MIHRSFSTFQTKKVHAVLFAIAVALIALCPIFLSSCTKTDQSKKTTEPPPAGSPTEKLETPTKSNPNPDLTADEAGLSKSEVIIKTERGEIRFKFYPEDAPVTVKRIIELINQGFYNGLTFHRVVPGFVIQGGDPKGNGTGGSDQKLKAEFNQRQHVAGTVAMARAADPDSADSQFYIALDRHPHLDRNYTVFGQVTEGLEVVKSIKKGDKMISVVVQ